MLFHTSQAGVTATCRVHDVELTAASLLLRTPLINNMDADVMKRAKNLLRLFINYLSLRS